jgi:hypothetical protein
MSATGAVKEITPKPSAGCLFTEHSRRGRQTLKRKKIGAFCGGIFRAGCRLEKGSRGLAMGWGAVWHAALAQFSAEPAEIRLTIIVAAAFAGLMILIGLRHAFRSAAPAPVVPTVMPELPKRVFAAAPVVGPAPTPAPQPFRAKRPLVRAVRKPAKQTINRQRALRPQIRRH